MIPDSATSIGNWAFYYNKLTSVKIGSSVQTIGEKAFADNNARSNRNKLVSVVIPPSVTSIGKLAFYYNKLTSVVISKALYNKKDWAFSGNPVFLEFYEYNANAPGNKGQYLGRN